MGSDVPAKWLKWYDLNFLKMKNRKTAPKNEKSQNEELSFLFHNCKMSNYQQNEELKNPKYEFNA